MAEYDIYIGFHFIIIIIFFPPSFLFSQFFPNPHSPAAPPPLSLGRAWVAPPPPTRNFSAMAIIGRPLAKGNERARISNKVCMYVCMYLYCTIHKDKQGGGLRLASGVLPPSHSLPPHFAYLT